jgi:hypothetical protein
LLRFCKGPDSLEETIYASGIGYGSFTPQVGVFSRLRPCLAKVLGSLTHGRDQLLNADDIDDSFDIRDEHGETHFASNFGKASGKKIAMVHPSFDRTKGVFNDTFTSSDLRWIRYHSLLPVFHDTFVHPASDATVFFIASAGRF